MEGIFAEVEVKKQYKNAQLQFQLEEDVNLPEMKPDLDTLIAQKWNVVVKEVKAGNGKVCVEGEVEYLILYSREDSAGRLEVLGGGFPFNQCLIMDIASGENLQTRVQVTGEQLKKRNNRKISVMLTMEMEAWEEGADTCRFMEDWPEDVEKKKGKLEVMSLCHMGKEIIPIKELVSLPGNRPDIGRILMDRSQLRNVEVYLEDSKFVIRGELFVFVFYESGEDNPRMQFVEMSVPFEREAECGICRDEMVLEYEYSMVNPRIMSQPNEDGEERDFALSAEMELQYELKEKREYEYLQDIYSLEEKIQPLWQEVELESGRVCTSRRVRINDVFTTPFDEKMLQIYPIRGEVVLSEPELVEQGVLVEGILQGEVMYLTANPAEPPRIGKIRLPFHQQFEMREMDGAPGAMVRGDLAQLTVNIIDSGQAEVKGTINLSVCAFQKKAVPVITKIEKAPFEETDGRMAGMIGYIVQNDDTLWSMAKDNKTTVEEICKINNITENIISPGEKLIICRNL